MEGLRSRRSRGFLPLGLAAALLCFGGGVMAGDGRAAWEAWKAERLTRLTQPRGWLSVVGLHWLEPGPNQLPGLPGTFTLRDGRVELSAARADGYALAGEPVERRLLAADVAPRPDVLALGPHRWVEVLERGERRALRVWDADAPARRAFAGLETYPFDPAWRVVARWEAYTAPRKVSVVNVLGAVSDELAPGRAWFTAGGRELSLEPTLDEGELFYVFRDATAGKGTYPAGRFLSAEAPRGGEVVLDFNRAYTPPCGFTDFATCPVPRRENVLPVAVTAGEKSSGH
jgi:uncharacterized protein (DUF1684 family)